MTRRYRWTIFLLFYFIVITIILSLVLNNKTSTFSEKVLSTLSFFEFPTLSVNAEKINQCVANILAKRLCATEFAALLELLDEVVAALEAAHITYFMSDGTLIGSWRHHGLIPWDDDIDLWYDYAQIKSTERALQSIPNSRLKKNSDGFLKIIRNLQRPQTTMQSKKGFVSGFWPDVGCNKWIAEIDLFSFKNGPQKIIPAIHKYIPIPRSAVFPLVLRPFEWRSTIPAMNLSISTRNSYSQYGSNLTSQRGVYRLLPAPRDPLRVIQPAGYTEIDKRCAAISHWMGWGIPRKGCVVLCKEVRDFIPFVYRTQNGSEVIERLQLGLKELSKYKINN
jgi:hypothetical protein